MKAYQTKEIRNIGLVGHGDSGKTSLVASMQYVASATPRLGRVAEGTTVTDFDDEERERQISMQSALAFCEWKGHKLNFVDTPGYAAFILDARGALAGADSALVVVDATHGVEVQTEKACGYAEEFALPVFFVVNKMDKERADFANAAHTIADTFGRQAIPFQIPIGAEKDFTGVVNLVEMKAHVYPTDGSFAAKEADVPEAMRAEAEAAREVLVEMVAESDEKLMEKFFEEGTLSIDDLKSGIAKAIAERKLFPILASSAETLVGIASLLNVIAEFAPDPAWRGEVTGTAGPDSDEEVTRHVTDSAPLSAFVFRTMVDQFGRISVMKILSGVLKPDTNVLNVSSGGQERIGPVHAVQGKDLVKIDEAHTGDIVAVTKLKDTHTGHTLADKSGPIAYPPVVFPEPAIAFAIEPKSRQDEEKVSAAIQRMLDEDLALRFSRDPQTGEFLLAGSGQLHVETVVAKLKKRGVEVALHPPKVAYRETITKRVESHGRHKKQSGGRGQFGDCKCIFYPASRGEGFEFIDRIFGGAVPQNFRPAIEKGIIDAASKGYVAGYPMMDFKVELIDGSYHTVDSDELSFKLAGRKAFLGAMEKAGPVLLEPLMKVEITAPQEFAGDIMGDLNSRRGRVQGMDAKGTQQIVKAIVPQSEMLTYQSTLNSITGARGSYHMEFSHYDEVPTHLTSKIVQDAVASGRKRAEEED
ncbi:MAG TPA: elongation factor G [Blastocatellia bacterium]|nr:elongation factor G [Blastocatellia bacterium]